MRPWAPAILYILLVLSADVRAACGTTNRTWLGTDNVWSTTTTWSGSNIPNTSTENAIIVSGANTCQADTTLTVGCVDVQSGQMRSRNNRTVTITGDYFRALTTNSLNVTAGNTGFVLNMNGTGPQEFSVVDTINQLQISGNNTVTLTDSFAIRNNLTFSGTSSTVKVVGNVTMEAGATAITIPAGVTLEIIQGAVFTSNVNITVNGTLIIRDGSTLMMANGTTVQVNATGSFQFLGSNGNIAKLTSTGSGATFNFNVAGLLNATYFRVDRMTTAGINVTGTILGMSNGEFHYIASAGRAITLGAAASIPASITSVGFFDDGAFGNNFNINATAYNGTATTISLWSGTVGGATKETDPNGKINWGVQESTKLTVSNNTPSSTPPTTIGTNSAYTHFATFAFGLTQADIATDITQAIISMIGTANSSDLKPVRVYKDAPSSLNCTYNAGVDTQIGSDLTLSGSPPSVTVNIPSGDVQTSSDTVKGCIHVLAATSTTAQDNRTIQFGISNTSDVTNSVGYSFSPSSGPPVNAADSEIVGNAPRQWQGDVSTAWNTAGNWLGGAVPTTTRDCIVGAGTRIPLVNVAAATCQNGTFQSGGTLNFNSTTNEVGIYGALEVQSGYTFQNATTGVFALRGASNQTLSLATAFPGNMVIANTGTAPNNEIVVSGSSTINGNLTLTTGRLRIPSGATLVVLGSATVQSGTTLTVDGGGTLKIGNGKVLRVNTGGTLSLVGSSGSNAVVTANSGSYEVIVNGTIAANYYSFSDLGTNGVSIEAGATIDATSHLQNCAFSYPAVSNSTMLKLKRQVPTNTMDGCSFSLNGSSATNVKNIDTTGAAAGTLTVSTYSGDLAGPTYHVQGSYLISWTGATNTIDIDQGAAGPSTVVQGGTYNMGSFRFKQTLAGVSYSDTDISSLKVTLTGSASSSDISQVRLYYDSSCSGTGGTLIGSGTFSGSPSSITFTPSAGATIQASTTTPPYRCAYVEYTISAVATVGATAGAQLTQGSHFANTQSYAASGATSFPVSLGSAATIQAGTATTWTGATNTVWTTAGNWNNGVPNSTKDCIINNTTNKPVLGAGTAQCKNLTVGTGQVTFTNGVGAVLEVYGNVSITGTWIQNDGVLRIADGGANLSQTIASTPTIGTMDFAKTGGGTFSLSGTTLTVNSLTLSSGSNFDFQLTSGKTLTLPGGLSVVSGTFTVGSGAEVKIGNGQSIAVSGGTFRTSGVAEAYPQNLGTKGKVTVNGSGTWGFNATGGTVNLTGFHLDYINTSGVVIGSGATLSALSGGQFTNLSNSYSSVRALQLNSASLPAVASNIGFNWGANNTPPGNSDTYLLVYSSGCGGNTITFDGYFGDFDHTDVNPHAKVSGTNCTITLGASASAGLIDQLEARAYDQAARLTWSTVTRGPHLGFNLYRAETPSGPFVQLNSALIRGAPGPGRGETYQWLDAPLQNGVTYHYELEAVYASGVGDRIPFTVTPEAGLGAPNSTTETQRESGYGTQIRRAPPPLKLLPPTLEPATVPGVIRMRYQESGLYRVTFEELPGGHAFEGLATSALTLYHRGRMIPLEVISTDQRFNAGDALKFYAQAVTDADADFDEVVLAPRELQGRRPARMQKVSGAPALYPTAPQRPMYAKASAEKNLYFVYDYALGYGIDHFFWKRMIHPPMPWNPEQSPKREFPVELPGLISNSRAVRVQVQIGGLASRLQNIESRMRLWVNSVPFPVAETAFPGREVVPVTFDIPAAYFTPGQNEIAIEAVSDHLPAGEYQILDVDKITIEYSATLVTENDFLEIWTPDLDRVLTVGGFTTDDIQIYDVSVATGVQKLQHAHIGGGQARFVVRSESGEYSGYRLLVLTESQFRKVPTLLLNPSFSSLKHPTRAADMIVIGHGDLLTALTPLISHRVRQGMKVELATPEQIFAEFSAGRPSSAGLRDFLAFARAHWGGPRFVLIAGKATLDPNDHLGFNHGRRFLPVPMATGLYEDFGHDNALVEETESPYPSMAVGRIPFDEPDRISDYVSKVLHYESGAESVDALKLGLFSDKEVGLENFAALAQQLSAEWTVGRPGALAPVVRRTDDAQFRADLIQMFQSAPLAVALFGHGALDYWSGRHIFSATDGFALRNLNLPVVFSLSCMNGMFYGADPKVLSLGESLIANPNGGAVAFLGSPALTLPLAQAALIQALIREMRAELMVSSVPRWGHALWRAKGSLAAQSALADVVRSYTWLGDPSLVIRR